MAPVPDFPKQPRAALVLALLAGSLALGACSNRDTQLAEAIAAAENAAKRAEDAATRAENAAKGANPAPVMAEDDPGPEPDPTESEQASEEEANN